MRQDRRTLKFLRETFEFFTFLLLFSQFSCNAKLITTKNESVSIRSEQKCCKKSVIRSPEAWKIISIGRILGWYFIQVDLTSGVTWSPNGSSKSGFHCFCSFWDRE